MSQSGIRPSSAQGGSRADTPLSRRTATNSGGTTPIPQQQQQQQQYSSLHAQRRSQQQQSSNNNHNRGNLPFSLTEGQLLLANLEEQIYTERFTRDDQERRLLQFEERCAAEKIEEDEAHRRRLLEMYLVAGQLREDRRTEFARERRAVENSCTPAVVEQLHKVAQHTAVERSVVDALYHQLEARMSAQRAAAAKEREKIQFYRTMLIRRMRQLEEHVRMVCGPDHWLLRLPELADHNQPFTSVTANYAVASSPAARAFDAAHRNAGGESSNNNGRSPNVADPRERDVAKLLHSALGSDTNTAAAAPL